MHRTSFRCLYFSVVKNPRNATKFTRLLKGPRSVFVFRTNEIMDPKGQRTDLPSGRYGSVEPNGTAVRIERSPSLARR